MMRVISSESLVQPTYFKKVILWQSGKSSFSVQLLRHSVLSFEIFAYERVERERSGTKDEDDDNRKEKKKFVGCDEFVRIAKDGTHPIDIGGEISDREDKGQLNGEQTRSPARQEEETTQTIPSAA